MSHFAGGRAATNTLLLAKPVFLAKPNSRKPLLALVTAGCLALVAGACASGPGNDAGATLGNLFAFNSTKAPPVTAANTAKIRYDVVCPVVDVKEGGAAHRVYNGRGTEGKDVRYQYSIGQTARECTIQNDQLAIRVGVEGKVLIGPAGSPSNFTVPVSIAVRDESNQQMVSSRLYQANVSVPQGAPNATFSVVSDTILVPLRRREANEDYIIFVGFETAKAKPERRRVSRRR